jgi:hypothetical protein
VKSLRLEALGLSIIVLTFAACAYLPFMRNKPPPRIEPSPTATPTSTPTPTATATPEIKKRKRRKRPARTPTPAPAGSPTPVAQATPAVTGTMVTTSESGFERKEIETKLAQVQSRVAAIKRDQLAGQDAADYDRIKSFVAEARAALQEQDDLRARSLVDKAIRLAGQLTQRVSSP